jgi:hypothetical protein
LDHRRVPKNSPRKDIGVAAPAASLVQPQTTPTRDVDITYQITRPSQPVIIERRRWLASEQLRRVDGPDKSATIFDRNRGELALLNAANHTYRKLDGLGRKPMAPQKGTTLKRGSESKIAGLSCIDWSWMDDTETQGDDFAKIR